MCSCQQAVQKTHEESQQCLYPLFLLQFTTHLLVEHLLYGSILLCPPPHGHTPQSIEVERPDERTCLPLVTYTSFQEGEVWVWVGSNNTLT